ncbi:MAG: ABC transporter ATP-binding protein [Planctomycetes bacterium]|nr:ABC transporter ATP-binding protein [Planctomycetota bacterium]
MCDSVPAQPQNSEIVRLEQIVKIYSTPGANIEVNALCGVSLIIRKGEYVAIMGASGSGKSTLMNIIGCLDRLTAGTYWLYREDVSQLSDDRLSDVRGQRIGFIFQNFNLIQSQTVQENLEVPMFYQGVTPHARRAHAMEIAERVELTDRLHHKPNELSGGQQQRVAIARALMNDPVMLLADEPTGNLDSKTGLVILDLLDELNAIGMTIVVVTHDQDIAGRCKRTIELKDGLLHSDSKSDAGKG